MIEWKKEYMSQSGSAIQGLMDMLAVLKSWVFLRVISLRKFVLMFLLTVCYKLLQYEVRDKKITI